MPETLLAACIDVWELRRGLGLRRRHGAWDQHSDRLPRFWRNASPLIAIVAQFPADRLRIVELLRGIGTTVLCPSLAGVLGYAAAHKPAVVVLHVADPHSGPVEATIRALRHAFPAMGVVVYAALSERMSRAIHGVVHAGATDLVLHGYDDLGAVVAACTDRVTDHDGIREALSRIERRFPSFAVRVLEHCLHRAHERATVCDIANAFGVSTRTLARHVTLAGLPSVASLITWSRLAYGVYLLEDPARSVDSVARETEFASPSAFRNQVHRYLGLRPNDVRALGGLALVLHAFAQALGVPELSGAQRVERREARDEETVAASDNARRCIAG